MSDISLQDFFLKKNLIDLISQSVSQTISNYTHTQIQFGVPDYVKATPPVQSNIVGTIGFLGSSLGIELALVFTSEALIYLYQQTFQQSEGKVTEEVQDLAGEFLNIAFGLIDAPMAVAGYKLKSSFPKTFYQKGIDLILKSWPDHTISIPMSISQYHFTCEVFKYGTLNQNWSFTP